jgi:hypothetical protein
MFARDESNATHEPAQCDRQNREHDTYGGGAPRGRKVQTRSPAHRPHDELERLRGGPALDAGLVSG